MGVLRALGAGEVDEGEARGLYRSRVLCTSVSSSAYVWALMKMSGGGAYVALAAVHAQDLDRHERVGAAALAVRERPKHLAVHLPQPQEGLGLRGGRDADLAQAGDVLPTRGAVGAVGVAWGTGLHRKRLPREEQGLLG